MKKRTVLLTEISICVALALVLDFIKIWRAPQGGSVNLAAVPIIVLAFRRGLTPSLTAGGLLGLLKIFIGGYVVHPLQAILDYPLAFLLLGLAGIFFSLFQQKNKRVLAIILGTILSFAGRFACHFLAGVIYFSQYAPANISVARYTAVYAGSHLLPAAALTIVVLLALLPYGILALDEKGI